MDDKNAQQMRAYREMPDEFLFSVQWVRVAAGPRRVPRIQSRARGVRAMRRGHQFQARSGARRARAVQGLRRAERYYEPL